MSVLLHKRETKGTNSAKPIRRERLSERPDEGTWRRKKNKELNVREKGGVQDVETLNSPAERSEVMIDCREGERRYDPSGSTSPNLLMKSGWMRRPEL